MLIGREVFSFSIAANTSNVNLRSAALTAGWNGTSKVVCTINSGVVVFSTSTGSYAMTINGSFPNGVELINNGTILGGGGAGGNGNSVSAGGSGGPALLVQSLITIDNGSGRIAGGGGGGGAGSTNAVCTIFQKGICYNYCYYPGGGGGGGIGNGAAGTSSYANPGGCAGGSYTFNGTAGTLTAAGSGGAATFLGGGAGGNGGTYGSAGSAGTGAGGGAAGACLVGDSNITWTAFGTRNGSIS